MYVGVVDGLVYKYADKFERTHTQAHPNIMANINRRAARLWMSQSTCIARDLSEKSSLAAQQLSSRRKIRI